jgi:hypothetical protein
LNVVHVAELLKYFAGYLRVTYYRVEKWLQKRAVDMLEFTVADIAGGKEAEGV